MGSASIDRYQPMLDPDLWQEFATAMPRFGRAMGTRVLWNVNSTARGGGVAELLGSMLPYLRGGGIDARWAVIAGSPEFFAVTKRIHNFLHGVAAGGPSLTDAERRQYEQTLAGDAEALRRRVKPEDIVIVHDPQPAGLIPTLVRLGCRVVWRCHVGMDQPNDQARRAWDFLRPYVQAAQAIVFSRRAYVWTGLDDSRVRIIAPSIDPFTPKNQDLDTQTVRAILQTSMSDSSRTPSSYPTISRPDGSSIRISRHAELVEAEPLPLDASLVVQVSRWDRLKDPLGVMEGFARHVAPVTDAHLVLAGPAASAVADDPEGPAILREVEAGWHNLPSDVQRRVHLAGLPMADLDENALMVNALQRRAQVVVQKSLAEGFGLTVAEAMWKGRPVVASGVGGIQDQIEDGRSGLLIDDPHDLAAFAAGVAGLLHDPARAETLGAAARTRVRREYLVPRELLQHAQLIQQIL